MEEKKRALDEMDKIIGESDLDVAVVKPVGKLFWWALLIVIGLVVLAFGFLVYS
jgi:hypothetical protein